MVVVVRIAFGRYVPGDSLSASTILTVLWMTNLLVLKAWKMFDMLSCWLNKSSDQPGQEGRFGDILCKIL